MAKPVRIVGWKKVSDYCITNGTHTVCKVVCRGVERFEAWDVTARPHKRIGSYRTSDEAREVAR